MPGLPVHVPTLTAIALAGFCTCAAAQERCPELTRLRDEATDALKKATGKVTIQESCEAYTRFSILWGEIASYAKEHRKLCGISAIALNDIDKRHSDAVELSKNTCTGRRPPFPADIR
jgi:hypothetical protein